MSETGIELDELIFTYRRCIEACWCRDGRLFSDLWNEKASVLMSIADTRQDNSELKDKIIDCVKKIQNSENDYSYKADIIENELIILLYEFISNYANNEIEIDEYRVFTSKSGVATLKRIYDNFQIHSTTDPYYESWQMAKSIFNPKTQHYHILGVGLGYLPYCLWLLSDKSCDVYVYDISENLIKAAYKYGALGKIDSDKLYTCIDVPENIWIQFISVDGSDDADDFIVTDWMKDCFEGTTRDSIEEFIQNRDAVKLMLNNYQINFWRNRNMFKHNISELIENAEPAEKAALVIAAGPSLNDCIMRIKENENEYEIFSVETSLKKLLANEIIPGYVAVIDPTAGIMKYLEGVEDDTKDIALVAEYLTNWKYIEKYKGPIYSVIADDFELVNSEYTNNMAEPWPICKTVTTFTILLALKLGHTKIHLVGLDLSYPGGKKHADGLGLNEAGVDGIVCPVRSNNGGLVSSSGTFISFKNEIEQVIFENPKVEFVNHSDEGAYIRGTYIGAWWETIPLSGEALTEYTALLQKNLFFDWKEKYFIVKQMIAQTGICPQSVYERVVDSFICELNWNEGKIELKGNVIYLFVSNYDAADPKSTEILMADAYKLTHEHNRRVLIVNTCENCMHKMVAINDAILYPFDEQMYQMNTVIYLGERYPYYQFSREMPQPEFVREFMMFLMNNPPEGIIAYDRYSLLAEACKLITTVEYR